MQVYAGVVFFVFLMFLVTLPVELFFGDSVFDGSFVFFVFYFFAKTSFLCSTRGHKRSGHVILDDLGVPPCYPF